MLRIVVGGQINKKEISNITKNYFGDKAEVDIKGDLEAANAMKNGEYDYYIGACNTGGGGALALAIALLGPEVCATISMPGKIMSNEEIDSAVVKGKTAFGFTSQHAESVLPVLFKAIEKKEDKK